MSAGHTSRDGARIAQPLSRLRTALSVITAEPPRPGTALPGTRVLAAHKLTLTRYGHDETGHPPVLLVPPPAAPAAAFDLREGQSLLEHLVQQGHSVYLADYGDISYADRGMGFEDWMDRILPEAIEATAADAGGKPHLVGWSLGGTLSLLTVAARPDLPITSLTAVGTPIDYHKVVATAPLRQAARFTGGRVIGTVNRLMGGIPPWFVRNGYRLTSIERELTKPWYVWRHADRPDKIDQLKSLDGFTAAMPAYPGRLFNQMWHQLMLGNQLATGRITVGDRTIELANVRVPVLAVGGLADNIAPVDVVRPITTVLTGAPSVRFETAPGGHLGVLTGTKAATTTWRYLDEHLAGTAQPADA